MIVKMDKYSFILFHSHLNEFLESIQSLGIVDITRENKPVDERSRELFERRKRYQATIKKLKALYDASTEEEIKNLKEPEEEEYLNDRVLLKITENLLRDKEEWEAEMEQLRKEYQESQVWGILDKKDITAISELGYNIHLFNIPEKNFKEEWQLEYMLHVLNNTNGRIYFAALSPKGKEFKFELPESKFPQRSCDVVKERFELLEEKLAIVKQRLIGLHSEIYRLEKGIKKEADELDLYLAGISSQKEAEGNLVVMTGFAPTESRDKIKSALEQVNVVFLSEEALIEDNPPVKLKNRFFPKLYEPIGELYMLPKYGELDLTPYFAPFYMLFFGLCLGDIGYGLILLTVSTLAKFKFPKFKGYLTLIQFLGLGAVIMASLPGVLFGTSLKEILPLSDSVKGLFFSDLKMFWFSMLFGLFQIVFARILNAIYLIRHRGWQYGMSNIGWSIAIVWATMKYASTMTDSITVPQFLDYLALAGVLLILLFSSESKNIISRLGSGIVSFWDVTSIFGDTLSYVRLFGLGTSGGILGMVVNSVAVSMAGIPYLGYLFAGLMLVVGHTMVLLLSSLGAFVHPMRLTFVEFYKNANFSGGGRAFRPLEKNN